jgi:2-keto-4-pentenoate hydratase/2-oxohepta-3-ene-1,7-dioic acid hydratase in catechol pathway
VLSGERIAPVGSIAGAPVDLRAAIASGELHTLGRTVRADLDLDGVELLPVIPNPGKILCVGHNYEAHRVETGRARAEHPSIFTRFADTLLGANDPVIMPSTSEMLDYEGELAVVIGKGGRSIAEAEAMRHVAGFSCFNDVSVRDWQWHTSQFTPGKNFPATAPFGPWLVTPDEIADLANTTLTTRLNGEQVQHASVRDMIFSIPRVIAYVSAFTPLAPGDVIATGTPGGVGAKREPPRWMKVGDVVEVEISGVGRLVSRIRAG